MNVKTHTEGWIRRCATKGLLQSNLADAVSVQHMKYAAENLFTTAYRARGFVMLRHPVKRAVDEFYYRQHATWERSYDTDLAAFSLEKFANSDKLVENAVVRMLNGLTDVNVEINEAHVAMAKEILRRKFLVSIFEWFDVGVVRLEKYYGWWDQHDVLTNSTVNHCHYNVIVKGDHIGAHPRVPEKEEIYSKIMTRNWADMELYQYAKTLFAEQAKLL